MSDTKKKPTITLETLLHVKREERPDLDFWNSFDSSFERRRLNALVERKTLFERFWSPTIRALAFSAPALLLVGASAFWIRSHVPVDSVEAGLRPSPLHVSDAPVKADGNALTGTVLASTELEAGASNQFVVDAMFEDHSNRSMNFRKVLYTPAIRLSIPTGASYVKDSMTSRKYGVTTADMKLGRNF